MIEKEAPLKYRLLVEKVSKDGKVETIGDTRFISAKDKNKILLLLKLMNLDLRNKLNNNMF